MEGKASDSSDEDFVQMKVPPGIRPETQGSLGQYLQRVGSSQVSSLGSMFGSLSRKVKQAVHLSDNSEFALESLKESTSRLAGDYIKQFNQTASEVSRQAAKHSLDQLIQLFHREEERLRLLDPPSQPDASPFFEASFSETEQLLAHWQPSQCSQIEAICLVGFDHSVGNLVEWVFPEPEKAGLSGKALQRLAHYALPDGSHLSDRGTVQFLLETEQALLHCVSCFGQVEAALLPQQKSISRNFVQKAVVVLSKLPAYGLLSSKVGAVTEALFSQLDFSKTQLLKDFFLSANNSPNQTHLLDHPQH
jgi:hypothetical protein